MKNTIIKFFDQTNTLKRLQSLIHTTKDGYKDFLRICSVQPPGVASLPFLISFDNKVALDFFLVWSTVVNNSSQDNQRTEQFSSIYVSDFTGDNLLNFHTLDSLSEEPVKGYGLEIYNLVRPNLYQLIEVLNLPINIETDPTSADYLVFMAIAKRISNSTNAFNFTHFNN